MGGVLERFKEVGLRREGWVFCFTFVGGAVCGFIAGIWGVGVVRGI